MLKTRGIAMTDGLNRKNHFFELNGILNAYEQSWRIGTPTNLNHDSTKLVGWTYPTGIYLEPGKAYLTNKAEISETKEEHDFLVKKNMTYLYGKYYEERKELYNKLREQLGTSLSQNGRPALIKCVAYEDENIVLKVFPEIKDCLHDGLIDINLLEPVSAGVYKKGNYLLFAHRFFRRNCSLLNSLNDSFLERLQSLRDSNLSVKIAIDLDLVGLSGTETTELEYQYWWGPKFDEDLSKIPVGVTHHKNEHYDNVFSNLCFTEFGWYIQDNRQTFECEEVNDRPNIWNEEDFYGCRFVHSMLNPTNNLPNHLDGAIRAYTDEKMLVRLESSIDKSERDTWYTKLWRIDNDMPVSLWKELICHYYRDNRLVGEYFGGQDEKFDKIILEDNAKDNIAPLDKYVPTNMNRKEGIRAYFSYHPSFDVNKDYDVVVNSHEYMFLNDSSEKIIESDTLTVLKLLKRSNLKVRIPYTSRIAYEDTIFNFPIFRCKSIKIAEKFQEAIKALCYAWKENGDDRLISYSLEFNHENEAVFLSFAGHVDDFINIFNEVGTSLPESEQLHPWLNSLYDIINKYPIANACPKVSDILTDTGILRFKRTFVPAEYLKNLKMQGNALITSFIEEKEIVNEIIANNIGIAPVYKVKQSKCDKCKNDYISCNCVKFIDDITETMKDIEFRGATWTNRHA